MSGTSRQPLVLDLDTGIDDALALAYVLGSPEVELVAVICSYGNVAVDTAVRNTHALLELLGYPDIPVYRGADRALPASAAFEPPEGVARIHGANGLGGQHLGCMCRRAPGDGVDFLVGKSRPLHEGKYRAHLPAGTPLVYGSSFYYVPTGPLTNLASALVRTPELARTLPRVTFMGGALTVPGNVTPCAEANVHNDPEAADVVLRLGLPTRMVGLDVTHQVVLTREDTARWRALGTSAGVLFADMTDHYIDIYEQNNPHMGGCALHDPLAVAAAIDPSLVGCLGANLCVDLEGPTRGRTVCDPERLCDAQKTCEVAVTVDAPRFLAEFRKRVGRVLGAPRAR